MQCQPISFADRTKRPNRRRSAEASEPAAAREQQSALILVVDDESDSREFLQELLVGEGFRVVAATSGAQALTICRDQHPDLAIVDVMMPGMTGFELCDLLRADVACREIPIIVYSAHETRAYSNTGLYDVAFQKPAEPDELLEAVRALLPADKLPQS